MMKICITKAIEDRWLRPATLIALGLALSLNVSGAPAAKPNVLLITVDDLNDWIGALGVHPQARTPHMDRLAGTGTIFTNAHCQAPICHPSRVSMMTGMLPSSTGMYTMGPLDFRAGCEALRDPRATPTMPEYFATHGYRTLGVGKVYHASSATETFQEYGPRGGFGPFPADKKTFHGPAGQRMWDWGRFPERDEDTPDYAVANWAIDRLQEPGDRPFFLAVGFFRPHVPMYAPGQWWDVVGKDNTTLLPPISATDRNDIGDFAKALTYSGGAPRHEWFVKNEEWQRAVHAYLACVSFVDAQIGRVLATLAASPHGRNTIVVILGDHGWALGEKQRWGKRALWERETKVPLIVNAPGFKGGRSCGEPAGLIDIYPTLVELCGLPAAPHLEGRSLRPQLRDPAEPREPVVTTAFVNSHAVRSRHHRYIRYADGSEELYYHRVDPNEWHNVASQPENKKIIAELARSLPAVNVAPLKDSTGLGVDPAWRDRIGTR